MRRSIHLVLVLVSFTPNFGVIWVNGAEVCESESSNCAKAPMTALLLGGTGATGKEVLNELNSNDRISKIVFITRRHIEFLDMPKVQV